MILFGGTGYLGNLIQNHFSKAYDIYILTQSQRNSKVNVSYVNWDSETLGDWCKVLENADVLINLAGKNINTRFTEENKKAILESRISSTEILDKAIQYCQNTPKMWLNASAIAFYAKSWEESKAENSPTDGIDFLSKVSQQWENALYKYKDQDTIKAVFRIILILGDNEGSAYQNLKQLVKLGGGGKAVDGKQMIRWMGETDFV